ncbi:65-kDa microtubule-associated protein 4 [Dissostichus eleginoides]|uniref:65-kDa microtubule-associated protein 4 n=1 Tax=Dissostichus eleginoides TaxID=100907 RepID=A0AAD9FK72_DISEL|nr:65-kDa microtubule-associated protein 4 [Dissostichus eleginoides]
MDVTPTVPLVLLGEGYVDKVVESASSELTSEDSSQTNSGSPSSGESSFVEVDTLSQQIDKDICNPVQAVSTQEESKSKDSKSLSPCPEEDRLPEHFQEDNVDAALPQLTGLKNIFYNSQGIL